LRDLVLPGTWVRIPQSKKIIITSRLTREIPHDLQYFREIKKDDMVEYLKKQNRITGIPVANGGINGGFECFPIFFNNFH
jgi:hypothetical protein